MAPDPEPARVGGHVAAAARQAVFLLHGDIADFLEGFSLHAHPQVSRALRDELAATEIGGSSLLSLSVKMGLAKWCELFFGPIRWSSHTSERMFGPRMLADNGIRTFLHGYGDRFLCVSAVSSFHPIHFLNTSWAPAKRPKIFLKRTSLRHVQMRMHLPKRYINAGAQTNMVIENL
ncbi:hypothetical protein Ddc_06664 [Ditylenchus destructor]|nr:hypothetical protein Ddc_06664 [Ditylenchus destructor]